MKAKYGQVYEDSFQMLMKQYMEGLLEPSGKLLEEFNEVETVKNIDNLILHFR